MVDKDKRERQYDALAEMANLSDYGADAAVSDDEIHAQCKEARHVIAGRRRNADKNT